MRIGTGRKPLRSSSHSEASNLPSSGSVKGSRGLVGCADAVPTNSEKRKRQLLAAATTAAPAATPAARPPPAPEAAAAALEATAGTRLRRALLTRLPRVGLLVKRVDRLAA